MKIIKGPADWLVVGMAKTRAEIVKKAIEAIRAFHDLGRDLPKKPKHHRDGYGKGTMNAEATSRQANPETLRKARQFADRTEGYTRRELKELCSLIKQIQKGQDENLAVFGRTHVIRLLTVPKSHRPALQQEAIEKGWSCRELETEIARQYGTRQDGGRRRQIPSTLEEFLIQAEVMCEAWRRWQVVLSQETEEVAQKHVVLDQLPEKIRKRITAAGKAISALHKDIVEELKERLPERKVRGLFRDGKQETSGMPADESQSSGDHRGS